MLPSDSHVALSPAPLLELLKNASHPGDARKGMSVKAWPDLHPFVDVIYLLPEDSPGLGANRCRVAVVSFHWVARLIATFARAHPRSVAIIHA